MEVEVGGLSKPRLVHRHDGINDANEHKFLLSGVPRQERRVRNTCSSVHAADCRTATIDQVYQLAAFRMQRDYDDLNQHVYIVLDAIYGSLVIASGL